MRTFSTIQSSRKLSYSLLKNWVHEILRRSLTDCGIYFFGIGVTYSIFQIAGHSKLVEIELKMWVRTGARMGASLFSMRGKRSPFTMLFVFFIFLMRFATLRMERVGNFPSTASGMLVSPSNSELIELKWIAIFSAMTWSGSPGYRSLGSKSGGFSLEL